MSAAPILALHVPDPAFSLRRARPFLVCLLGLFLMLSTLLAAAAPGWNAGASLQTARYQHTATLLPNGKVLVAGGYNDASYLASPELYDPATNTWSAAAALATARSGHTATLLPNGKVLVAGGAGDSGTFASAELYDPATNTWSAAGALISGRHSHTATLLPNGKVLVAGGYYNDFLASAELYDPATNSWSAAGSLTTARYMHTATLLPNGKVLVAGGFINGAALASAELYDPATNSWSAAGALTSLRYRHTATLLPNGKVLVAGGQNSSSIASAELYDPAINSWSAAGALTTARRLHTATLLPNGTVLVAGGIGNGGILASAELYDPATNSWSAAGTLTTGRYWHTATLLPNGTVLCAGGNDGASYPASAELYDPAINSWSAAAALVAERYVHTATLLPNGKVLVAGGLGNGILASAELYDPANNSWTAASALTTARLAHTATLLPNGKVLVAGGNNDDGFPTNAELYDPATNSWSTAGALTTGRRYYTATLLANGKVLVAGGSNNIEGYLASAELYDPATNSWSAAAVMTTMSEQHTATLLPNGKVLVAGGYDGTNRLASAELYDPATDSWSAAGALTTARAQQAAALLPNGKVLVAGGFRNGPWDGFDPYITSAELYDPATNSWSAAGDLTTGREQHQATLLPNGKVLVPGGYYGGSLASAELYDPATNSWTAASALTTARQSATVTLLPNGTVLVTGGYSSAIGYTASAELFNAGMVPDATRQPLLSGVTAALFANTPLTATGTGFWPNLEGSGSGTNSSTTNFPLIQVMRLDSGQTRWLQGDSSVPFSDTAFTSIATALSGFPSGHVRVTAFVNGIPSVAQLTMYTAPTVPDAPVIGTATAGDAQATVTFTAPASNGGSVITGYTVTSNPSGGTDSNAGSTGLSHVITGLTNGQAYTFTVTATNIAGTGAASATSNSVTPLAVYTLTYTAGANGSITGTSPQTVNHGSSGSAVTAVPATGYHFVNWSDASTANPRTDSNVTGNKTVTANFAINTYTLSYTAGANGSITGTSPQTVNHGSNGSAVTAVPATGYRFVNWSDASTANPRTDSNVTGYVAVNANFAINPFSVSYHANTATGGSVPVDGLTYATGATVTVLGNTGSLVKPGFTFAGWNTAANGSGTSRPAASTFAMGAANVVLYAQFATVPGAPVIGTAVPGGGRATVSFAAPASNGGSAITSYTVTCLAAGQTTRSASGAGSPITVSGLTAGIAYACSAVATNGAGSGASSSTVAVTPLAGINLVPILLLLLLD